MCLSDSWGHRVIASQFYVHCEGLMPSAHGAIFCRKELRENVGVKVRFFLGLSQRTRPIFCRKQLREKIRPIFSRTKSQRTQTDFLSELLCVTIAGEVSLLDDVTPIFYRTEVSTHGPIFCRKQLREMIGAIFYRSKSQRTRTDFLSTIKNWHVCAGHKHHFQHLKSYWGVCSLVIMTLYSAATLGPFYINLYGYFKRKSFFGKTLYFV